MKKITATILIFAISGVVVFGQKNINRDLMQENFFPPELIMDHQHAIGLTGEQQQQIRTQMKAAQSDFMDFNWEINRIKESLTSFIAQPKVAEEQTLQKLEELLSVENKIKLRQLQVMIRIKNILTPEQQAALSKIKKIESNE